MARTRALYPAVLLIGFCGVVAQVVVLREVVVTFYGNELCVGAMLGTWLFWTGLGSLGLGRLARRLKRPGTWLAGMLAVMALLLVATVAGARCLKLILRASEGASFGRIRPFGTMLASAFILLGPFCLINGFLFPLACRAAEQAGGTVGAVYLLEAAGAATGGACYTFLLIHWLDTISLAFVLAAGCWCVAAGWKGMEAPPRTWRRAMLLGLGGGSLGAAAAVVAADGVPGPVLQIDAAYWRPFVTVGSEDSPHGRVTVMAQKWTSEQRSLYVNGTPAFSYPDPPVAEGVAHLPMLQHPAPRRVLLLGGGPGAVEEVLKHPSVERLTYVELDPLAVEMVRRHFPPAAVKALKDRRVEVVLADGRAFVKGTPQRYDVGISAVGPPRTAQANRFYTVEYFREAASVLEPGGVFAFQASGGHDYIPEESRRLLACLHASLAAAFPHVLVFSGAPVTFLASNREGVLGYRLGVLDARMAERGVATSHVDARFWEADLVGGRLEELQRAVAAPAELNRDLAPRCYYYEAQRWSALQRVRRPGARPSALDLGRVLEYLDRRPLVAPLALLGLLAAMSAACALFAGQRRAAYTDAGHGGPAHRHGGPAHRQGGPAHRHGGPAHRHGGPAHRQGGPAHRWWRDGALAFSVASTGLIEMGVEFSVLLGFQVVCGYVYHYVGLLVASFMFGLALGAWVSSRWVRGGCATWRRMVVVQLCICAYPLALLGFLALSAGVRFAGMPAVAGVLFSLAALSAGFVGGLQFPLAVALHTAGAGSAGPLYGLDLFGSCLGALAVSSLLAPSLGLPGVCLMLAGLAGLGLLGLVASSSLSSSSSSSNL